MVVAIMTGGTNQLIVYLRAFSRILFVVTGDLLAVV
jgi:hypothetical protein